MPGLTINYVISKIKDSWPGMVADQTWEVRSFKMPDGIGLKLSKTVEMEAGPTQKKTTTTSPHRPEYVYSEVSPLCSVGPTF